MLGYGGHWSTKSRAYSTTFGQLRRARREHARRARFPNGVPLDAWGRPEDEEATVTVVTWRFVAVGYTTTGDAWLALSAAARAREQRDLAREELRSGYRHTTAA